MSYPIKVYHKTKQHVASVTEDTTFDQIRTLQGLWHFLNFPPGDRFLEKTIAGELKHAMAQVSGVQPDEMKLYFRGKSIADDETMGDVGIKPNGKILLVESGNFRQRRAIELEAEREQAQQQAAEAAKQHRLVQEEARRRAMEVQAEQAERDAKAQANRTGLQAVEDVGREVDPLASEVNQMVASASSGEQLDGKRSRILNELFTQKLLKLDSIQGGDDVRKSRKAQISRIEKLSERLDALAKENDQEESKAITVFDNRSTPEK